MKHPRTRVRLMPIRKMLALPLTSRILPPILEKPSDAEAERVEIVAKRMGLNAYEAFLVGAFCYALDSELEHTANMCLLSRVTDAEIQTHAREIGVPYTLKGSMIETVRMFGQFMLLLERMRVVEFKNALPGRTLLGYEAIEVRDGQDWQAVLNAVVIDGIWYSSKAVLYEKLLMWGFGQRVGSKRFIDFKCPTGEKLTGKEKKIATLVFSRCFYFHDKLLKSNLKRYVDGHMMWTCEEAQKERADIIKKLLETAKMMDAN